MWQIAHGRYVVAVVTLVMCCLRLLRACDRHSPKRRQASPALRAFIDFLRVERNEKRVKRDRAAAQTIRGQLHGNSSLAASNRRGKEALRGRRPAKQLSWQALAEQ